MAGPERRLAYLAEMLHAPVYFWPGAGERYAAAGLPGFWRGYFASRAAALGPVGPQVVTALFAVFSPAMVARAVPEVWQRCAPAAALRVRTQVAVAALATSLDPASPAVAAAAGLTRSLVDGLPDSGRALAAAHRALDRPEEPLAALWHDVTVLREFRGDGHVAVLTAAGLSGLEATVLQAATGVLPEGHRSFRGWSEPEWADAAARLAARGYLDPAGRLTDDGGRARAELEDATDASVRAGLAAPLDQVSAALEPLAAAVRASGLIPFPNAMGLSG